MAKRKRLETSSNVDFDLSGYVAREGDGLGLSFAAPIARAVGDTAQEAALLEVTEALQQAREEGRLIQRLPLGQIDTNHLMRDRIGLDEPSMASLVESIRSRGQQTPIEVVALSNGRYGLISGWRRVQALCRLEAETKDACFGTVLALLRHPRNAAESYISMVEENEIRLGLSYYERARIVERSVEAGVFKDAQTALRELFTTGSRARRSKIGSFRVLVAALDDRLRFPVAIGERLGLQLAKRLETEPDFADRLRQRLTKSDPTTPEAEMDCLSGALKSVAQQRKTEAKATEIVPGVLLSVKGGPKTLNLTLSGANIDPAFQARLLNWLKETMG